MTSGRTHFPCFTKIYQELHWDHGISEEINWKKKMEADILAGTLISCVILGKNPRVSEPNYLHFNMVSSYIYHTRLLPITQSDYIVGN